MKEKLTLASISPLVKHNESTKRH